MDDKIIFSTNLNKYMELNNKSRRDICDALGFSYFTFTDWVKGRKMPRMDKIVALANYFGVEITDLIEERSDEFIEAQKNNDAIADIVLRLRTDQEFLEAVSILSSLEKEKFDSIKNMLSLLK